MLPDIHLDQMSFSEMVDRAKNQIAGFYPEWTDFNYHDPGITLVELFAWRKEIQQYEMDHVGDGQKRKYLQLLGTDVRHGACAETYVTAGVSSPCLIPEGSRLEASGVIFETTERQMLPGVSVRCCFGWLEDVVSFLDGDSISLGHPLEFYPFGIRSLTGTCLYIGLSGSLPPGEPLALTIHTCRQERFPRNPPKEDTVPLARLSFSYWDGSRYQSVELIRDETFGLLFDGQILFRTGSPIRERRIGEEKGFFLRVRLEEGHYEAAPALSFLDLNTMRVRQKETVAKWLPVSDISPQKSLWSGHSLCNRGRVRVFLEQRGFYREVPVLEKGWEEVTGRTWIRPGQYGEKHPEGGSFWILADNGGDWYSRHCVLGTGHGFPGEWFEFDEAPVSWEDVEILVEEAEEPEVYQKWEKREDFANSGPEDRHFCVDCIRGRILFGDGIHGMAPEGRVLLVSYSRILGSGGNVKAGRIQGFPEWEDIPVNNPWDARGGRDEETVGEAFVRVQSKMQQSRNLVTAQDYEEMVKATPGLRIESCKALFGADKEEKGTGQLVRIVVKPYSRESRPRMTHAFIQNILQNLEKKRLLGVRIRVISPVYIRLSVYLEAAVHPQYQGAESMVEQAVREYLTVIREQFGGTVSYSSLYGYIDRLDCVEGIRSLTLEAKGNHVRRNAYGDLIFPGNGIADEIDVRCSCSILV